MSFKPASEINKAFQNLLLEQSVRGEMLQRHFHMYGHSTMSGDRMPFMFTQDKIKFNLVQACSDTLLNKVSKNAPRARFLTDFGEWSNRKKAEQREKFVFGEFYKSKIYEKTPYTLLQCLIFGDGWFKVWNRDGKIKAAPRLTTQVYVNEADMLGDEMKPREIFEIAFIDIEKLKQLYPAKAEKLASIQPAEAPFYINSNPYSKLICVVEYFRMVCGDDKGEHRIIAGDTDLIKPEAWNRPLPYAHIGFMDNPIGFYSKGVAEVLTGHQVEVNRTLRKISDTVRLSSSKVLYDYNSKIVKAHFNNDVGTMIGYLGQPPQFINPPAMNGEMFSWLQYTVQRAYEEIGISQLSAASAKPAGLNSGKALREYSDIETERFAALVKKWESLHIQIAELVLEEASAIAKEKGNYKVLAPNSKGCAVIDFKSIDMEKDSYYIQCYPTSMLPKTPAGRLEYVQEMAAAQFITPEEALSLLDFPDTEKITRFKASPMEDALATVDYMLEEGIYLPPEPYQNLAMCIKYMQSAYLYYKNQKCPEDRLDLLVRWIDDANMLIDAVANAQAETATLENSGPMSEEEEQAIVDEATMPTEEEIIEEQMANEELAETEGVI